MSELKEKFSTLGLEQIRENVRRTIMSYRHSWDIYTELIQNSVDAIIDKFDFDNINEGRIKLDLNTNERKIIIEDNGIGIKSDNISDILVMGESIKRKENKGKYGFMGYGFTFVAFQTEYLKIESVYKGEKASRTYYDLYRFVFEDEELPISEEEKEGIEEKDNIEIIQEIDENSYTKITAIFPDEFPDKTLENNINSGFCYAKNKNIIEYILRRKSAIGIVDSIFLKDKDLYDFDLIVDGSTYNIKPGYFKTREIIETMYSESGYIYNIDEYHKHIKNTEHLDESAKRVARKAMLIDGVVKDITIGVNNPLNARLYIAETSKKHLNNYSKNYMLNEKNDLEDDDKVIVENGLWLALDGLPTGICLDDYSHPSYLPFTVVVDVIDKQLRNELDSGRKGITSYRAKQISKEVKRILKEEGYIEYRKYVTGSDTRITTEGYDAKEELLNKFNKKDEFNIDLIHKYFPVDNEQEVISIFIELISQKILIGYEPKVLSGYEVYDGLFRYNCTFQDEVMINNDSLGIAENIKNQYHEIDKNIVVEFKTKLKKVFDDVKDLKKRLDDIDLLVCWDVEFERADEFVQKDGIVLNKIDRSENFYHGATHQIVGLGRNSTYLPIVELKKVLNSKFDFEL